MKKLVGLLASAAIFLGGCGGGGSDSGGSPTPTPTPPPTENKSPVVNLSSTYAGEENTDFSVTPDATDEDGTISSYDWEITSTSGETIYTSEDATLTMQLPSVSESEAFTLTLTVTDNDGASATASSTLNVEQVVPVLTLNEKYTAKENSELSISPSVTLTSGEIVEYRWTVSNQSIGEISGADTETLSLSFGDLSSSQTSDVSLTVVDSDGDTATASTVVEVTQEYSTLTIEGVAIDAPLDNAEITVLLNGEEVQSDTFTDAAGNFIVDVDLSEVSENAYLSLTAKGSADQAVAHLVSLVGSLDMLLEQSGSDGVLTREENSATTVSNITTAKYGLLLRETDSASLYSDETVAELSSQLDGNDLMALATAIKVAVDRQGSQTAVLPEGIVDTRELVENEAATIEYLAKVIPTTEYLEVQQEMMADPNLFALTASFPEAFSLYILPRSDIDSVGSIYQFFMGGTGTINGLTFDWSVDGAKLQLNFEDKRISTSTNQNVQRDEYKISETFTLINKAGSTVDMKLHAVNEYRYPNNPELENERREASGFIFGKMESSALEIEVPQDMYVTLPSKGGAPALSLVEPTTSRTDNSRYERFSFKSDGTAQTLLTDQTVQWSLQNGVLRISGFEGIDENATDLVYRKVSQNAGLEFVSAQVETGNQVDHQYDSVGKAAVLSEAGWTEENVVGIYGPKISLDNPLQGVWRELKEGGIANTYSVSDENDNGVLEDEEVSIQSGSWTINGQGELEITRFREPGSIEFSSTCRVESSECLLYNTRTWKLINIEDGVLAIAQTDDQRIDEFNIHYTSRNLQTIKRLDVHPLNVPTQP